MILVASLQVHRLLGSSAALGNPVGLVGNLGTVRSLDFVLAGSNAHLRQGVRDFFYEPGPPRTKQCLGVCVTPGQCSDGHRHVAGGVWSRSCQSERAHRSFRC